MVEVQLNHINGESAIRFSKEQPWCGKHFNSQEQIAAKNVYNYALKNKNVEKTPMCRIAELARYHKIKHEYILLDECGPAHKKQFRVKLVLKAGEEYEGQGASIKKAQQSAAENALLNTSLQLPPQRKPVKSKNETNPVYLLYSVASQLELSVRFEEQVEVMALSKNYFMPNYPPNDNKCLMFMNQNNQNSNSMFMNNNYPPSSQNGPPIISNMQKFNQDYKPEIICGPWTTAMSPESNAYPASSQFQPLMNGPTLMNCTPNNSIHMMSRMPPPPNKLNTPPPLIPFHTTPMANPNLYKCSFLLSDGSEHRGQGRTMVASKIDAALNALFHLRPLLSKMEAKLKDGQRSAESDEAKERASETQQMIDSELLKQSDENSLSESDEEDETTYTCEDKEEENGVKQRRPKPKSVVSQIHECAYRLKMNVEFEIVKEAGEPHNRRYILSCTLSSPHSQQPPIVAVGEGSSKKAAKQNACQLMLEKVKGLDNDALYLAHVIVKQATKKTPITLNGKDSKRKTIIKDMKKDPQYGQHINPISRLIQVMQSRKEKEPEFCLIGERGQNRYREFVVQVNCVGLTQTGFGPNKKLAKRAAAVAMLEEIGYVKPMPQPGKSLLKKRSNDSLQTVQVEIGVFDPSDLSTNTQLQQIRQFSPNVESKVSPVATIPQQIPSEYQHSNPTSMETFADVDNVLAREISQLRFSSDSMSPPMMAEQMRVRCDSEKQVEEPQPIRSQRRRVTFSNQVSSCPPPEDVNYPDATIAPLKSEVVLVTKLKKRGRDSKKALTPEEKFQIASTCRLFCRLPNGRKLRSGYMANDPGTPTTPETDYLDFGQPSAMSPIQPPSTPNIEFQPISPSSKMQQHPLAIATPMISNAPLQIDLMSPSQLPPMMDLMVRDAKFCLERLAKHYKFTVSYSDFPKAADEYFSLVTLGLDKPILCHGCGETDEQAHKDAAYNAICYLAAIDKPPTNQ